MREVREAGLEDVKFAVLEVDGAINVVPKEARSHHSGEEVGR